MKRDAVGICIGLVPVILVYFALQAFVLSIDRGWRYGVAVAGSGTLIGLAISAALTWWMVKVTNWWMDREDRKGRS